MPHFFFDTYDGVRTFRDDRGVDLPGPDDVPRQALTLLCELADGGPLFDTRTIVATVRDGAGETVVRTTMTITSEAHPR